MQMDEFHDGMGESTSCISRNLLAIGNPHSHIANNDALVLVFALAHPPVTRQAEMGFVSYNMHIQH